MQNDRHSFQNLGRALIILGVLCSQALRIEQPARVLDGYAIGGSMPPPTVDGEVCKHRLSVHGGRPCCTKAR
jgi:hypothetical protein